MLYRVIKGKVDINLRKIECPLEHTLLLVFVALERSSLVDYFQMEYDQIPEKFLSTIPSNMPHATKSKK